ncbi:PREDICTED: uncharacterized protein LOC106812090 [Priapulus caudatus]|uniref:Uncharacterized protein LOC106812090 n=1 Tax=Priapulus caudatus TaxID=37621 RepID=A0ABM1EGM3_PRICU|nr:PREDICTED: uncharacterized protein LOC106812090 [Priapulus caudatus]
MKNGMERKESSFDNLNLSKTSFRLFSTSIPCQEKCEESAESQSSRKLKEKIRKRHLPPSEAVVDSDLSSDSECEARLRLAAVTAADVAIQAKHMLVTHRPGVVEIGRVSKTLRARIRQEHDQQKNNREDAEVKTKKKKKKKKKKKIMATETRSGETRINPDSSPSTCDTK